MADQLAIADASVTDRFEVGREYVTNGPAEGSRLGPQMRCAAVEELDDRYRVKGHRLPSPYVLKAAVHLWHLA